MNGILSRIRHRLLEYAELARIYVTECRPNPIGFFFVDQEQTHTTSITGLKEASSGPKVDVGE